MSAHILIVDDDDDIRYLLRDFLSSNSLYVSTAASVAQARILMKEFEFNLIVMDIMMPNETGIQYLVTAKYKTPVILVSALSDVDDKINGLKSGAEDYLSKPFDPRELLARIERILNRYHAHDEVSSFGNFVFNHASELLLKNNQAVAITSLEANILKKLLRNYPSPVHREELMTLSVGENSRAIDTTITRLRAKIEENPKSPQHIISVRGIGYMIRI